MISYTKIKDQNSQNEQTIYWFDVDGEMYGVSESHGESQIIDCDGYPVNTSDTKNQHLSKLVVTETMRDDF